MLGGRKKRETTPTNDGLCYAGNSSVGFLDGDAANGVVDYTVDGTSENLPKLAIVGGSPQQSLVVVLKELDVRAVKREKSDFVLKLPTLVRK